MYIRSTDSEGIYHLLWHVVSGIAGHHRIVGQPLDLISVQLNDGESASVTSHGPPVEDTSLERGSQLLERELYIWEAKYLPSLFIANALCAQLQAIALLPQNRLRFLTFETGLLRTDEVRLDQAPGNGTIQIHFWPDFTILGQTTFDYFQTVERMRTFSDNEPHVTVIVTNGGAK